MKNAFKQTGRSYAQAAEEIGCSKTAVVNAVVHGVWPKKAANELREQWKIFFKKYGADIPECLENERNAAPAPTQESKDDAMLLKKASLTQSARRHFGLVCDPFHDEIRSADDVFQSPDIRYVREAMFQTALHGGFVAVVGESGAGKSTLREDLQDRILREGRQIVLIEPYVLAMEDNDIKGKTLKSVHIAEAVLEAVAPGTAPKRSPEARFRQVHRALMESSKAGNRHVLMIEEALLTDSYFKTFETFFRIEKRF